jgi:pimeloyl-ACP methyl ester carboxylesterase
MSPEVELDFVLVHGAYHGSWCWQRLIPELEARGHRATAVDLPIDDPGAGAREYADVICEAVDSPDATVVGHSMLGLAIPLIPERVAVKRLVFLCAFLPEPGSSFNELREREDIEPDREMQHAQFTNLGEDVWMVGPETANELFYHDAPSEIAAWSVPLLRPQAYRITREKTPLTAWPEVPCSYVLCRDDRVIDSTWARRAARERLGVEALELDGGHSPFLTRPGELATVLDGLETHSRNQS